MIFHRHKWKETHKVVAEPRDRGFNATWVHPDTVYRLTFGMTTYVFQCEDCSEIKTVETVGIEKSGMGMNADRSTRKGV